MALRPQCKACALRPLSLVTQHTTITPQDNRAVAHNIFTIHTGSPFLKIVCMVIVWARVWSGYGVAVLLCTSCCVHETQVHTIRTCVGGASMPAWLPSVGCPVPCLGHAASPEMFGQSFEQFTLMRQWSQLSQICFLLSLASSPVEDCSTRGWVSPHRHNTCEIDLPS